MPTSATTDPQSRPRQPLSELPLHLFVGQSLLASPQSSPKSRSRSQSPSPSKSRRSSRSVSPHKQAVIQSHQRARAGSTASLATPSQASTGEDSDIAREEQANREMATVDATPIRRKLFQGLSASASFDVPLENSPILSISTRIKVAPSAVSTPRSSKHSSASGSPRKHTPATPTDALTTPKNLRMHRPTPVNGPKPINQVEPSPSMERHLDVNHFVAGRGKDASDPITPSRQTALASPVRDVLGQGDAATSAKQQQGDEGDSDDDLPDKSRSPSKALLKSLPKKKFRVSKMEIAIAHEIVGSGPIGSPSPRKMAPILDSGLAKLSSGLSMTSLPLDAGSSDFDTNATANLLSQIPRATSPWTVWKDNPEDARSDFTAPSQDHSFSPKSASAGPDSPGPAIPSTPNKENRQPASNAVERLQRKSAEPTNASASPASGPTSTRKRGTGGRLSLLARVEDGEEEAGSTSAQDDTNPLKKSKTLEQDSNSPIKPSSSKESLASRRSSPNKSPEAIRRRRSRKVSTSSPATARRLASATVGVDEAVASRTRSKTRPTH